ncbi:DUF3626 domain-containing protein [Kribbella sp. NPDC026611]|uniref:DUF3626 domain-containing protein n=1 Tax=Kribbella sp. NPDC026611 TaxID=3154911 RepID=UPI0033DFFBE3
MSITLHFHPDRLHNGRLVIESMAADGCYFSQFVIGISNGGLTAFPGGARWSWESRLFAGRYDDQPAHTRPVYGAWNHRADPYGGAIRFGSSYLRLRPEAVDRATFCFPDSYRDPQDFGDKTLLPHLCTLADDPALDDLDNYVEAHVHGPVNFTTDVEALVLDPSFANTPVHTAAAHLGCPTEFHPGFTATPSDLDPTYRGPHIITLAKSLGPELTPAVLTTADAPPQDLKHLWHCLARFGRKTQPGSAPEPIS